MVDWDEGAGAGIFTNTGWLAGIGKLPAPTLGGWYFGWYFWYCTYWQEPSFDDLVGNPFLKNLAGAPLRVSHMLGAQNTYSYMPSCIVL
jgi:hypothetical protein